MLLRRITSSIFDVSLQYALRILAKAAPGVAAACLGLGALAAGLYRSRLNSSRDSPHGAPSEPKHRVAVRGLRNPGNLCFLNSVLQAMASSPKLVAFITMAHPLVNGEMAQAALCKSQMVAALSKVLAALGPITVDRKTVMPAAVAMEPLSSSKEVLRCMGGTQLRDGKQQDASEALEHICAVLTADLAHWFRKDHAPVIYLSMAMKEVLDGTSMEGVVWRQMPSSPEKVTSSRALLSSTSGVVDERNEGIVRAEMATLKATNVSPEEGAEDSRTSCNPNLSNSALPHIRNQASPGWSGQFIRSTGCCSDPHTCSCMRDENRPSSLSVLEKNGLCSPKANCSGMQTNQTRGNDGTQALKEQVLHTSSMHTVADDSEHDEKSNHGHDVALKLEGIKSEAHKGTSGNGQAIRLEPNGDSSRSQHTDRTDHSWDGSSVDVCMLASEQETEHHGCLMQAWRQLGSCPMQGYTAQMLLCLSCGSPSLTQVSPFAVLHLTVPSVGDYVEPGTTLSHCLDDFIIPDIIPERTCPSCSHRATVDTVASLVDPAMQQLAAKLRGCSGCLEECDCEKAITASGLRWVEATRPATKRTQLARLPKVLCLQLCRAHVLPTGMSIKIQGHIGFPPVLDMQPYCSKGLMFPVAMGRSTAVQNSTSLLPYMKSNWAVPAPMPWLLNTVDNMTLPVAAARPATKGNGLFRLVAVIQHHGGAHSGHYTAFRWCPFPGVQDGCWKYVSDTTVGDASEWQVYGCEASMLVYEQEETE